MSTETKYCKDCKHYSLDSCWNPDLNGRSLVNGRIRPRPALDSRLNSGYCGLRAKGFEQKPPSFWKRIFG